MKHVCFVKLKENAIMPHAGSARAAGYDLHACIDEPVEIAPHTTVKIGTGLAMTPPEGHFGAIFARSGMATKQGLAPANKVGVCDIDYTGEYIVALHNHSEETQIVQPNDRIAQVSFIPYATVEFVEVDVLEKTERGAAGFGSTGSK